MSENITYALLVDPSANRPMKVGGKDVPDVLSHFLKGAGGIYDYPHFPVEGTDYFFVTADLATDGMTTVESKDVRPGFALVHGPALIFAFVRDEFGSPDLGSLDDADFERLERRTGTRDGHAVFFTD